MTAIQPRPKWKTQAQWARDLGISTRSLNRWRKRADLSIPKPDDVIGGVPRWRVTTILRWERSRGRARLAAVYQRQETAEAIANDV